MQWLTQPTMCKEIALCSCSLMLAEADCVAPHPPAAIAVDSTSCHPGSGPGSQASVIQLCHPELLVSAAAASCAGPGSPHQPGRGACTVLLHVHRDATLQAHVVLLQVQRSATQGRQWEL